MCDKSFLHWESMGIDRILTRVPSARVLSGDHSRLLRNRHARWCGDINGGKNITFHFQGRARHSGEGTHYTVCSTCCPLFLDLLKDTGREIASIFPGQLSFIWFVFAFPDNSTKKKAPIQENRKKTMFFPCSKV